jgi:hypothetical protein
MRKRSEQCPRIKIQVTKEIIANACKADSARCMIADALKVAYPDAQAVIVDLQLIRFSDPKSGRRYEYLTPQRCQVGLVDFDQGIPPEPFEFRLQGGFSRPMWKKSPAPKDDKDHNSDKIGEKKPHVQPVIVGEPGHGPPTVVSNNPRSTPASIAVGGDKKAIWNVPNSRRRVFGLRLLSNARQNLHEKKV